MRARFLPLLLVPSDPCWRARSGAPLVLLPDAFVIAGDALPVTKEPQIGQHALTIMILGGAALTFQVDRHAAASSPIRPGYRHGWRRGSRP